jgi:uncharacterized protein (TIGR03118 family)
LLVLFLGLFSSLPAVAQQRYQRVNLVSDIPGVALRTDPNLINPWGMAFSPTSPVWISDNNAGVSTLYTGKGEPFPIGSPLVVTIPPPAGGSPPAAPTGIVFNPTLTSASPGFVVSANGTSGPSVFIFATEDGTISGWSPGVDVANAILAVDNSVNPDPADGAVYKGLAIATRGGATFIYATNFRAGVVEMYDSKFTLVNSFTGPNIPAGFAPFGIQTINGHLYVTFAKQNDIRHDDLACPGCGVVDVFDTDGNFDREFASGGSLNSPWGLALAPAVGFGKFNDTLLIGNFGDGRINAFEDETRGFLGQLQDELGTPLTINGLWGLKFGNGGLAGKKTTLLFTAGIADEKHGLFGVIRPAREDDLEDDEE